MNTLDALAAFIDTDDGLRALHRHASEVLGDDPGHDVHHALRVALWTVHISREEERGGGTDVDPRESIAAALLHDIVNLPKNHPDRALASELAADEARRLLPGCGFDAAAVERVAAAICDHSFSRGAVPTGALGRSLQDADRLEALGAIGIMRCVSSGAQMGGGFFDPTDPWAVDRELDGQRWSIDHFFRKLLRLPETMLTEAGRTEARRRAAVLERFCDALAEELARPRPAT